MSDSDPSTQPMPRRTCSRCEHWARDHVVNDKGVVAAVCHEHNEWRRGSETCSAWERATTKYT